MKFKIIATCLLSMAPFLLSGMEEEDTFIPNTAVMVPTDNEINSAKIAIEHIFIDAKETNKSLCQLYEALGNIFITLDFINPESIWVRNHLVEHIKELQHHYYPTEHSIFKEELTRELKELATQLPKIWKEAKNQVDKSPYENGRERMAELLVMGANPNVLIEHTFEQYDGSKKTISLPLSNYLNENCICGNLDSLLVIYGADVNYANEQFRISPPVERAALHRQLSVFKLMVIFDGHESLQSYADAITMRLSMIVDEDISKFLVKYGFFNESNKNNWFYLFYQLFLLRDESCNVMVKSFSSELIQDIRDESGDTFLHTLCSNNKYERAKALLEKGIKDCKNFKGEFAYNLTTDEKIRALLNQYNEYPEDIDNNSSDESYYIDSYTDSSDENSCDEEMDINEDIDTEKENETISAAPELEQQDSEKILTPEDLKAAEDLLNILEEMKIGEAEQAYNMSKIEACNYLKKLLKSKANL